MEGVASSGRGQRATVEGSVGGVYGKAACFHFYIWTTVWLSKYWRTCAIANTLLTVLRRVSRIPKNSTDSSTTELVITSPSVFMQTWEGCYTNTAPALPTSGRGGVHGEEKCTSILATIHSNYV